MTPNPVKYFANRLSRPPLIFPAFYALLFLAFFASVLFSRADIVISHPQSDLAVLFVPLRAFAAQQLRAGHIPLWNPHIFCGSPFVGNFQSALFYPLTWLHAVFPLVLTINWTVALEFFLAAWFTALCCHYRNVGSVGSLLGGIAYSLSGAFFLRLYAGHLATIGTMTWAPLVLLCLDHLLDETSVLWCLIGGLAVALMLLAGSPPQVYNTALIFAVYTAVRLIHAPRKLRVVTLIALMGVTAIALSAIQILPGLRATQEAVRAGGTSYDFAADGPLPPENILTLFSARLWGDDYHDPYTGRSYMWESSLYIGMATTLLAAAGMFLGPRKHKWSLTISAAVAIILALGTYAQIGPFNLFQFLFNHFPMYNRFRDPGRYGYQATLCLAILASMGVDQIPRTRFRARGSGAIALLISLGMGIVSLALWKTQPVAATQIAVAAGIAAATGILAILAAKWRLCASLIPVIAAAELICTAVHFRLTCPAYLQTPSQWTAALLNLSPDERILHTTFEFANQGMIDGTNDIYGYDPTILQRYAQLIAVAQHEDPDSVDYAPDLNRPFPLLSFMRCRYILPTSANQHLVLPNPGHPLPRLQLIDSYRILTDAHQILSAVNRQDFDASANVILESPPTPTPVAGTHLPGYTELVGQTTDAVEVRANVTRPCLLVISDAYSQDWRATPLLLGAQSTYSIMPANYAFMAIPLSAGPHHIKLQYRPAAWTIGLLITAISLPIWFVAIAMTALARVGKVQSKAAD